MFNEKSYETKPLSGSENTNYGNDDFDVFWLERFVKHFNYRTFDNI